MNFKEAVATVALAVCVVTPMSACVPPELATSVGDGSWVAGKDIRVGTWATANAGPHNKSVKCEWTVSKKSNTGTVLLRGVDTREKVQRVYVGSGEVLKTANCGTWGWLDRKNLT